MEPNNWMLVIQRKNGEIYKPVCGISAEDILSNYVKTPEYFTSVPFRVCREDNDCADQLKDKVRYVRRGWGGGISKTLKIGLRDEERIYMSIDAKTCHKKEELYLKWDKLNKYNPRTEEEIFLEQLPEKTPTGIYTRLSVIQARRYQKTALIKIGSLLEWKNIKAT